MAYYWHFRDGSRLRCWDHNYVEYGEVIQQQEPDAIICMKLPDGKFYPQESWTKTDYDGKTWSYNASTGKITVTGAGTRPGTLSGTAYCLYIDKYADSYTISYRDNYRRGVQDILGVSSTALTGCAVDGVRFSTGESFVSILKSAFAANKQITAKNVHTEASVSGFVSADIFQFITNQSASPVIVPPTFNGLGGGWTLFNGVPNSVQEEPAASYPSKYLIGDASGTIYTFASGLLIVVSEGLSAASFAQYGMDFPPPSNVLLTLTGPKVYKWQDMGLPQIEAKVYGVPQDNTVTASCNLSQAKKLKQVLSSYSGNVTVSFDAGSGWTEPKPVAEFLTTAVADIWTGLDSSKTVSFRIALEAVDAEFENLVLKYVKE